MKIRVLSSADIDILTNFEMSKLDGKFDDETEKTFFSWKARWRKEALEHYLNLGWSMGVWTDKSEKEFLGYFLGQVLLFYRGMTQTLWVEHLSAKTTEARDYLFDSAYRYSREKHLQKLLADSTLEIDFTGYKNQKVDDEFVEVFTSKANS